MSAPLGSLVNAASMWGRRGQLAVVLVVAALALGYWLRLALRAWSERLHDRIRAHYCRELPPPLTTHEALERARGSAHQFADAVHTQLVPAVDGVERAMRAFGRAWSASVAHDRGPAPDGYGQPCARCGGISGWLRVMACPHPPTRREHWRDKLAQWGH